MALAAMLDAVVVGLSLAVPFGFAVLFFSHWLFKDYEIKNTGVLVRFSGRFVVWGCVSVYVRSVFPHRFCAY